MTAGGWNRAYGFELMLSERPYEEMFLRGVGGVRTDHGHRGTEGDEKEMTGDPARLKGVRINENS